MSDLISNSKSYLDLLGRLKEQIRTAQVKAALAVNRELILLYWNIGKQILERQNTEGWGKNVIPRLSKDLSREFPEMKGLSPRNLGYMKPSPRHGRTRQFCSKLLQNYRGSTTASF